jgi:TPR repeat protein
MARTEVSQQRFLESTMAAARAGRRDAFYELGIAFSVGSNGVNVDLIEAHKWFNLAAMSGDERAALDRSEVAADMTPAEIAAAQREARAFLVATRH